MDTEYGARVRIKKLQPWAEEYGTCIGYEQGILGTLYKIKLDNGHIVMHTRYQFITLPKQVIK